ncbi:hypothetical protein COCNU_03G009690 [Cocos nucifera]|uniref:Uncharacterized protein n=1 Tax=Cocos nucifera TaxID=13894 RepID=A0A8K0I401_COCNU|nr:hypothetical protein COCNU_03G009690 [Cocos nucifera]
MSKTATGLITEFAPQKTKVYMLQELAIALCSKNGRKAIVLERKTGSRDANTLTEVLLCGAVLDDPKISSFFHIRLLRRA